MQDIRRKINKLMQELTDEEKDEREILNQLLLVLDDNSKQLPKSFSLELLMNTQKLKSFLTERVGLKIKKIKFNGIAVMFSGKGKFEIELE